MAYAALYIISLIAAIFILQQFDPSVTEGFALVSSDVVSRPWILVTSIFLHSGLLHLLYNGFGLFLFGLLLEKKVGMKKFLLVFFASGIFASVAASFFYHSALGASGAVFGVIGALAVLTPLTVVWVYYIPMPLFVAAAVWAVGDLFGFIMPSNVANAAHLAGLFFGVLLGFVLRGRKPLFARRKRQKEPVSRGELEKWEDEYMLRK